MSSRYVCAFNFLYLSLSRSFISQGTSIRRQRIDLLMLVLPDPFRGMGTRKTPQRTNSRATPQGLDQESKWPFRSSNQAATCYYHNHSKVELRPI